jgi:hypothetical protein
MVMEQMVKEHKRLGPNEVRITNVYTVEASHEASGKHDPTPNWAEMGIPNPQAESFRLRIDAEAGRHLVENFAGSYSLIIQAACLTNPLAVFAPIGFVLGGSLDRGTLASRGAGPIIETFAAAGWEYDAAEDKYTKSWSIHFPQTNGLYASTGGLMDAFNQVGEVWQFFVSLEDSAAPGAPKTFGCTAASAPFRLLP